MFEKIDAVGINRYFSTNRIHIFFFMSDFGSMIHVEDSVKDFLTTFLRKQTHGIEVYVSIYWYMYTKQVAHDNYSVFFIVLENQSDSKFLVCLNKVIKSII